MMSRLATACAVVSILCTAVHAEHRTHQANIVYLSAFDTGRNATTITNQIARAGARNVHFVADGGYFSILKDITWPTNVTIEVIEGSHFDFSGGSATMTFQGNQFIAGDYLCFTGATGVATGNARFPYRYDAWGDTNRYFLGNGPLASQDLSIYYTKTETDSEIASATSAVFSAAVATATAQCVKPGVNNTYSDSTIQSMWNLTVRNDLSVAGDASVAQDLDVTGDVAVSGSLGLGGESVASWDALAAKIVYTNTTFAGYPQITLSTNMITTDHSAAGSSLAITNATFVNAFDGATNTFTSVGRIDGATGHGTYTLDLGAQYIGIVTVHASGETTTTSEGFDVNVVRDKPTYQAGSLPNVGYAMDFIGSGYGVYPRYAFGVTSGVYHRLSITKPFIGRYVNIIFGNGDAASADLVYKISQIDVYGVAE